MSVPSATYRVQLGPGFGFDDLARHVPYLASLGVSHLYLSPVLQAAPGSAHGYDVVDHRRVSDVLGGLDGLERLAATAQAAGLGLVVDIVPNHMAVPVPEWHNAALWSVLRDGPASPHAGWFDIDWDRPGQVLVMPVLGDPIGDVLDHRQLTVGEHGEEPVLRYYDHAFPIRPGTETLPLEELLEAQWYRLAWWRVGDEELNYRRFFDIDSLAAVRVERPEVFDATHELMISLVRSGLVDGLRVDHPDGLADPEQYFARLAEATGGAWVVAEKILERDEPLPHRWQCAGSTGYDALAAVGGLFVDEDGWRQLVGQYATATGLPATFAPVAEAAKREVLTTILAAEGERLVESANEVCTAHLRLRDHTRQALRDAVVELIVALPRYRAYVAPGGGPGPGTDIVAPAGEAAPADGTRPATDAGDEKVLLDAAAAARAALPDHRHPTVDFVVDLALGHCGEPAGRDFCVRFQQTSVSAMAKGVEDTALYRWTPLASTNEVGGDPARPAVTGDELHRFAGSSHRRWPDTMTALSTHDTKRGEDTRARLAVLSELPGEWGALTAALASAVPGRSPTGWPDPAAEWLVWQTVVGLWPRDDQRSDGDPRLDPDRVAAYFIKALREAKVHTSWLEADVAYEDAVTAFVEGAIADGKVVDLLDGFVDRIAPAARANVLGQKLVQLTMPGVADVYQGSELEWLAVVDPDNRRPVDYEGIAERLATLDAGGPTRTLDDEKLWLTASVLRLRRAHPEWFDGRGSYEPLAVHGNASVAFTRGGHATTVVSRFVAGGTMAGDTAARAAADASTPVPVGPGDHNGAGPTTSTATVALPVGRWRNVLCPASAPVHSTGEPTSLDEVLGGGWPVALLVREHGPA